jgi:hypothetical protein
MYSAILLFHSWFRWLVLVTALVTLSRAVLGLNARKLWSAGDDRSFLLFIIAIDVQTLLGLVLYVGISPITAIAFQNLAAAMRDASLRFFVVEHAVGMVIAVALAHIGRVRVRRSIAAHDKQKTTILFVALALIVMLLAIPWPGMPGGRPLFRF